MPMRRYLTLTVVLTVALTAQAWAQPLPAGTIAAGTPWATPYYDIDTGLPGPTVVITGGVHGDEPAGAAAALELLGWTFKRGRVVIIPQVNTLGLDAGKRLTPGAGLRDAEDLNRAFPREEGEVPAHPLAASVWELLLEIDPDWVVDLHEGERFRINEPREYTTLEKSVGNSVITPPNPRSETLARELVNTANGSLPPGAVGFVLLKACSESRGQLYRAAHEPLGAHGLIIETVNNYQPLKRRVTQHLVMVEHLFTNLDMLAAE